MSLFSAEAPSRGISVFPSLEASRVVGHMVLSAVEMNQPPPTAARENEEKTGNQALGLKHLCLAYGSVKQREEDKPAHPRCNEAWNYATLTKLLWFTQLEILGILQ